MGSSSSTAGDAGLVGLSGQTTAGDELLSGGSATLESGQVGLFRVLDGRDVPKLLHDRSNISSLVERTIWHFLRGYFPIKHALSRARPWRFFAVEQQAVLTDEEVIYEAAHDRATGIIVWEMQVSRRSFVNSNKSY